MKNFYRYKKVLLVEDDLDFQNVLSDYLQRENNFNIRVDAVDSCIEALLKIAISEGCYDLVIVDHQLRGHINGLFLCSEIAKKYPKIHLLMLSGISTCEFADLTKKQTRIPKFLSKPFSPVDLDTILCDLLEKSLMSPKMAS